MTISEAINGLYERARSNKDAISFLSIHARGNVLHLGLCEDKLGITALLYGIEQNGGHIWTVNPFFVPDLKEAPYFGHPQWSPIEADPLELNSVRGAGVPEELDLLFLNAPPNFGTTLLDLKTWGPSVKTTGLIIVAGVTDYFVAQACEDFAASYGMKFRARPNSDLGAIFYPDNKEAAKNE